MENNPNVWNHQPVIDDYRCIYRKKQTLVKLGIPMKQGCVRTWNRTLRTFKKSSLDSRFSQIWASPASYCRLPFTRSPNMVMMVSWCFFLTLVFKHGNRKFYVCMYIYIHNLQTCTHVCTCTCLCIYIILYIQCQCAYGVYIAVNIIELTGRLSIATFDVPRVSS